MNDSEIKALISNFGDECKMFIPQIKYAKVCSVHDGDTLTVIAPLCWRSKASVNESMYKFSIRLRDVDTPEMKGSYSTEALLCKNIVSEIALGKVVELSNLGKDKYGRLLCNVNVNGIDISKFLLHNGYAKKYHGEKKLG